MKAHENKEVELKTVLIKNKEGKDQFINLAKDKESETIFK
jgi:hypothetical protein